MVGSEWFCLITYRILDLWSVHVGMLWSYDAKLSRVTSRYEGVACLCGLAEFARTS